MASRKKARATRIPGRRANTSAAVSTIVKVSGSMRHGEATGTSVIVVCLRRRRAHR